MATLFLVFAVLLLNREFKKREKSRKFDIEMGKRPKEKPLEKFVSEIDDGFNEKEEGQSHESDSEKQKLLQKLNEKTISLKHERSNRSYGTFFNSAERSQYMVLFQKHPESPPDKPLYTIAFYTPAFRDSDLKSAYTLSSYKSTISTVRKRLSFSQLSFFDGNTPSSIKPPSPVSDNGENTSQWYSPATIDDSQQKWIHSLSPISSSKQNTSQCTVSDSEQTPSEWLLSPIASVNRRDTPKWVLSPQGKSREGSDLYRIYSPHSSVPISPPITAFIIELETTPLSSKRKIDIEAIDNSSGSYSFSSPNSSP